MALVMSHDFAKHSIGIKVEVQIVELYLICLVIAFQVLHGDNGDVNLKLTQRQCNHFMGMYDG